MTYDPKRNILFIHIPKNAGRSIEVALGMVAEDELRNKRYRSPLCRAGTFLQRRYSDRAAYQRLYGTIDATFCAQHLSRQEIELIGLVPEDRLAAALKIAVCRNPWDRAVSTFCHFSNQTNDCSSTAFQRFWEKALSQSPRDHNVRAHLRRQIDFLRDCTGAIDGVTLLRFERLTEDWQQLRERLPHAADLPRIGSANRRDYREYFNDAARRLIDDRFGPDIEAFGYRFNGDIF